MHLQNLKQDFPKSTAKDMNLLMQALIKKYPQILQISKLPQDTQEEILLKVQIYL